MGKGLAEFISEGENIEMKIVKVLSKAVLPALSDWNIQWPVSGVTQAPSQAMIPNVYYNETFNVFALLGTSPVSGDVALEFTNTKTDQRQSTVVHMSVEGAVESNCIHKFWAKEVIRELELYQRLGQGDRKTEIVELSR
jgi:hypothetical protein